MHMSQFHNMDMANNNGFQAPTNTNKLPSGSATSYLNNQGQQSLVSNTLLLNGVQATTDFPKPQVNTSHNLPFRGWTGTLQQDEMLRGNTPNLTVMQQPAMQQLLGQQMINNQGLFINQPYLQNMYACGNAQANNVNVLYGSVQSSNANTAILPPMNNYPGAVQQLAHMSSMPNTSTQVMASTSTRRGLTPDQVLSSMRKALIVAHELTRCDVNSLTPAAVHERFGRISKMFSPTPIAMAPRTNHPMGGAVTGASVPNLTPRCIVPAMHRNQYMGGVPLDDIRAPPRQVRNATKPTKGKKRKRSTSSSTVTPQAADQMSPITLQPETITQPPSKTINSVVASHTGLDQAKTESKNDNLCQEQDRRVQTSLEQIDAQAVVPMQATEQETNTHFTTSPVLQQLDEPSSGIDWMGLFGDPTPFNEFDFSVNDTALDDLFKDSAPSTLDTTSDVPDATVSAG